MWAAWLLATALGAPTASAGTITPVTNFGPNPSGIGMYLYTPTTVDPKPAILVGVHACHGKGLDVCSTSNTFAQQAEKYHFLMICPSAVSMDGCWDVHSTGDLTHGGSGDVTGIMSMVNWVVQNKQGDANRVYAAGHSSGGMMTNVLLGSYPDVFKAGASFAGVPFACYAQGPVDSLGWNTSCATGKVTLTGMQWGDIVRGAYPGFTGTRPRIQLWHGTADATVDFHNFGEAIKEWTNVLGVSETPTSTENNALMTGWIRTRYANAAGVVEVEAIQETGQPHNLVINGAEAIRFFGLDGSNPVPGGGAGGGPPGGGGGGAGGPTPTPRPGAGVGTGGAPAAGGKAGGQADATGGAVGSGGAPIVNGTGGTSSVAGTGGETGGGIFGSGGSFGSGTGGLTAPPQTNGSSGGSPAPQVGTGGSVPGATAPAESSSSGCACAIAGGNLPDSTLAGLPLIVGLVALGLARRRPGSRRR
jgi:poly(hydroxyalkanoate) depolymerase family esterase